MDNANDDREVAEAARQRQEREERLDQAAGYRPGWHDEDAPLIFPPPEGVEVADWPVTRAVNEAAAGAEAYTELARLRSIADPERDARREAYQAQERRKAARALDAYIEIVYADTPYPDDGRGRINAAGERFVEEVGDYVMARIKEHWQGLVERYDQAFRDHVAQSLQQKSHYGVPNEVGLTPADGARWARQQNADYRVTGDDLADSPAHPCANGRCPDPAAHAEGAHDL